MIVVLNDDAMVPIDHVAAYRRRPDGIWENVRDRGETFVESELFADELPFVVTGFR